MTGEQTIVVLSMVEELWPQLQILSNAVRLDVWSKSIEDLDFKECQTIIMTHIATSNFPVTIADIRKNHTPLTGKKYMDPLDAWGDVERKIGAFGADKEEQALSKMDPIVAETARMMGWRSLCVSDINNRAADRARFMESYKTKVDRDKIECALPPSVAKQANQIRQENVSKLLSETTKKLTGGI